MQYVEEVFDIIFLHDSSVQSVIVTGEHRFIYRIQCVALLRAVFFYISDVINRSVR